MDRKFKIFLDECGVPYARLPHAPTFTALETAASAHVAARELAKTVMLRLDGQLAMAVVPATHNVDFAHVRAVTGAADVTMAKEREFEHLFPDSQPGAMPPFGHLYGVRVYVAEALAEDLEIAFNAGAHDELVKMSFADYKRLAHPIIARISEPRLATV